MSKNAFGELTVFMFLLQSIVLAVKLMNLVHMTWLMALAPMMLSVAVLMLVSTARQVSGKPKSEKKMTHAVAKPGGKNGPRSITPA